MKLISRLIFIIFVFVQISLFGQWEQTNAPTNLRYNDLLVKDNLLLSCTDSIVGGGVLQSSDTGNSWSLTNTGLGIQHVRAINFSGTSIICYVLNKGIYVSDDNGNTWAERNNGLTTTDIRSIEVLNNSIFVGTASGLFKSDDVGQNWAQIGISEIGNETVKSISVKNDTLYTGTNIGLFKSNDFGATWFQLTNGLPATNLSIHFTKFINETLFISNSQYGLFYSTDYGVTFLQTTIQSGGIQSMVENNNVIFATQIWPGQLYKSLDFGLTWNAINAVVESYCNLEKVNGAIYFGWVSDSLYVTSDNFSTWSPVPICNHKNYINSIKYFNATLFMTTNTGLLSSSDLGLNWKTYSIIKELPDINSISNFNENVIAASSNGIFITCDDGNYWHSIHNGFAPGGYHAESMTLNDIVYFGGNSSLLYTNIGTNGGGLFSPGLGMVTSFIIKEDRVFVGSENGIYASFFGTTTWEWFNNGLGSTNITSLIEFDNKFYAGTFSDGVYCSIDSANNWNSASVGLPIGIKILSFAKNDTLLFVGTNQGVFFCTNSNPVWVDVSFNLPISEVSSMEMLDSNIFVVSDENGIWKSDIIEIYQTSDLKILNLDRLLVYPNPSNNLIYINGLKKEFNDVEILNLAGIKVLDFINTPNNIFDLSSLSNGLYILRINHKVLSNISINKL